MLNKGNIYKVNIEDFIILNNNSLIKFHQILTRGPLKMKHIYKKNCNYSMYWSVFVYPIKNWQFIWYFSKIQQYQLVWDFYDYDLHNTLLYTCPKSHETSRADPNGNFVEKNDNFWQFKILAIFDIQMAIFRRVRFEPFQPRCQYK